MRINVCKIMQKPVSKYGVQVSSLVPVSPRIVLCGSGGALGLDGLLDYPLHGLARNLWRLASSEDPGGRLGPRYRSALAICAPASRPTSGWRQSRPCSFCARVPLDGKHLGHHPEYFSFLYAFSRSSRFVLSIPHQHGRGSLLISIWRLQSERTFSRRYSVHALRFLFTLGSAFIFSLSLSGFRGWRARPRNSTLCGRCTWSRP